MAIPTDADVDSAVPVSGVPHRGRTNSLLKEMNAAIADATGTIVTPTLQRATPSDSDTITINQTAAVVTLLIEGSAALNLLHLLLPQPGASKPGQIVRIVSWIDVAAVDYGTADVNGASTQYFSGDGISLQNIDDNEWLTLP